MAEDIVKLAIEMITEHGYEIDEVIGLLRRSHSIDEIKREFSRSAILRDYRVEIDPDIESRYEQESISLSQAREQKFANEGKISEQQEAARIGTDFEAQQVARKNLLRNVMRVTGREGKV